MLVYVLHEELAVCVDVEPKQLREAGDELACLDDHHRSQLPRDQEVKRHVACV